MAEALRTYEEARLPFANLTVERSQDIGRLYCFYRTSEDGSAPPRGSQEELDYVRKSIEDAWEWQNESTWTWLDAEARWRMKVTQA